MKTGVELIADERRRQVEKEGWSSEHDDGHTQSGLAVAGACYALVSAAKGDAHLSWRLRYDAVARELWPFDEEYWKPSADPGERLRDLVKAGALIAAEIDRVLRHKAWAEQ